MRKTAGSDEGDLYILRIALDRPAQRLPQFPAAQGRRDGELEHTDLQRHDLRPPSRRIVRQEHRKRGEDAMIQSLVAERAHIELVGHQRLHDVAREARMSGDGRHRPRAAALVRNSVTVIHAEAERRIVIEEKRRDVIVVDHQQDVGLAVFDPSANRPIGFEDRLPGRIILLVRVERETDGRGVRGGDRTDDGCHGSSGISEKVHPRRDWDQRASAIARRYMIRRAIRPGLSGAKLRSNCSSPSVRTTSLIHCSASTSSE